LRRLRSALGLVSVLAAVALHVAPASAATTVLSAEAESGTVEGWYMQTIADAAASGGAAVKFGGVGSVKLDLMLPADADAVTLRVRGDQCAGAPPYTLSVDGALVAAGTVADTTWTDHTLRVRLLAGRHAIEVRYTSDHGEPWPNACDRNLYLDALTFSSSGSVTPAPELRVPDGFVRESGTQLLDGDGRPLRLRGVNLGGWLLWEGWIFGEGMDYVGESTMMSNLSQLVGSDEAERFRAGVRANFVGDADFKAIATYGLNVARVPFSSRLLEDDAAPFTYKAEGWAVLDKLVQDAKRHGVYLVLDMHAAPCGQSMGFVSDYVGPQLLWNSGSCQDRTVAMWKAIAARYANENIIAGYDLLNESVTGDAPLRALYQRLTAAIREVDRNHLLIYEGNDIARTFDLFGQRLDANQMLSFHDYPWASPGEDLSVRMAKYVAAAKRLDTPMWAGEFGQSGDEEVRRYVDTFDQEPVMAGWAQWTWKQAPGFSALQTIQYSAAAKKLVLWMNDPRRSRPTLAEAQQGMADFIEAIRFPNTVSDASFRQQLGCRYGACPAGDPAPVDDSAPASARASAPATTVAAVSPPRVQPAAKVAVSTRGRLRVTIGPARLAQALRAGLRLSVVAPGRGRVTAVARRGATTVARGAATAGRPTRTTVTLSFGRSARKALHRARRLAVVVDVSYRAGRDVARGSVRVTLAR
jgi:hypothetical protein